MNTLKNLRTSTLLKAKKQILEIINDDDITNHERELMRDDLREIRRELIRREKGE